MGIDIYAAISQAKKLDHYDSTLQEIRNALNSFKGNLNNGWKAREMVFINDAIDHLNMEINRLSSDLESLCGDIVSAAYDLKREENEKAAAAAAAAAKANAQMKQ